MSLPAHPLPFYFAAGSLAIFAVLVAMFRRGAPSGMMLTVACLLGSGGKLALETLRAEPRPPGIMFFIPEAVLTLSAVVLMLALVRRVRAAHGLSVGRRAGKAAFAGLLVGTLAIAAPPKLAAQDLGAQPGMSALATYARDPLRNRRLMRRLERQGTEDVSPLVLIAMADARLRAGQRRAAARLFEEVLDRDPGEPYASWARLGLGWSALLAGEVDTARPYLEDIAAAGSPTSGLAKLLVALIDAGDGKPVAAETFDQVAADPLTSPALREVAQLGSAYARYWAGNFREAAAAFDGVARDHPETKLADDAQYAAAWARVRAGDRAAGEAALRSLAGDAPKHGAPVSEALVNLEQRALLRAEFERYRRGPLRAPEDQVIELLDGDGRRLARAALHYVDTAPHLAIGSSLRRPMAATGQLPEGAAAPVPSRSLGPATGATAESRRSTTERARAVASAGWRVLGWTAVLGIVVLILARVRRSRSSLPRGDRRA